MTYSIDLSGKVAIVTGAGKGIGLATATILAQAGAQVVIDDIVSPDRMTDELSLIGKIGPTPDYIQADISDPEQIKSMVDIVYAKYKRIDFLVNNAGVVANWQKSFDIHVKAVYDCSETVRPVMQEIGGGKIVNLTSTSALTGGTGIPQYAATKGGTFAITRFLAKTYAPLGIRVNGVMPAVVMSDMIMTRYKSEQEMLDHYIPLMPIRRIGYPEDIAKVVLFLCSDLSDFICGEVIVADGGRMYVG